MTMPEVLLVSFHNIHRAVVLNYVKNCPFCESIEFQINYLMHILRHKKLNFLSQIKRYNVKVESSFTLTYLYEFLL